MLKGKSSKNDTVNAGFGVIFIILLSALLGIVYLIDDILPTPLNTKDEGTNPDAFIESRALDDLRILSKEIGPRITGTYENEVLAVEFLVKAIRDIQDQANSNKRIELDVQTVSGHYYLDSSKTIIAYGNVQNVVVKLYSEISSNYSLLLNSHFDTVPISPGGSDDGINCVVMLEILRKLSMSNDIFHYNIIFLFNGAEETPLQASHGFITQHKWAKEVKVVINLEAAGSGGKATLFQAGPNRPWLISYFKKLPYPNGNVVGEELFESGIIPSDTDFRIFRDYGNTIGYDFAFVKNAHVYHTKFDKYENVPPGSAQQVGENTLQLTHALAKAPELENSQEQSTEKVIFYDYFGLFVISYSATLEIAINVVMIILSLQIALTSFYVLGIRFTCESFKYLGCMLGGILLGWIAGTVIVVGIGFILDGIKFSMRWYNNSWIILGLYIVPVIICCCTMTLLFSKLNQKKIRNSSSTQIQIHLVRLIWSLFLLVGTIFRIRSVYVIFLQIFFQTIVFAIVQVGCLQHSLMKWFIIFIVGAVIPTMYIMQLGLTTLQFLIPISGRIGPNRNPELEIALISALFTILITSFFVPLVTLLRKSFILLGTLSLVFIIFFVISFTPLGFPYSSENSSPTPQRYWIHHMGRTFRNDLNNIYKVDSGYFVLHMDRNSPGTVEEIVSDFKRAVPMNQDCIMHLSCGLPLGRFSIFESTWIPAEYPIINNDPIKLTLNSQIQLSSSIVRYNFLASGPHRFEVYISPRTNIELINISLLSELPQSAKVWKGRPLYVIMYTWGKTNVPLEFSIDVKGLFDSQNPKFDIALVGRHLSDKTNIKTENYTQFLNQFPDWTDVEPWLGIYESWVY